MKFFDYVRPFIRWTARKDARVGVYLSEERALAAIGPRPEFVPDTNMEDAQLKLDADHEPTAVELAAEAKARKAEFDLHPRPLWQTLLIGALFVAEFVSANLVLKEMGIGLPDRNVLAAGLAVGTWFVINKVSAILPREGIWGRVGLIVLLAATGALFLAIGAVRNSSTSDINLPRAILFVFIAVGPALLIEHLMARRKPAVLAQRKLQESVRHWQKAQRRVDGAKSAMAARARAQVIWTEQYTMRTKTYDAAWRQEAARCGVSMPAGAPSVLPSVAPPAPPAPPTPRPGIESKLPAGSPAN